MTNEQKKDWFLKLDPNGRIPVLVDNATSPPFTVHETSAELLYLLKHTDKKDTFGFTDQIPVLIYAGDADYICNWLGNKAWTDALEWHGKGEYGKVELRGRFFEANIFAQLLGRKVERISDSRILVPPQTALAFYAHKMLTGMNGDAQTTKTACCTWIH